MRPSRKNMDRERERAPQTRINEMIRVPKVLLIDEAGENLGEKRIEDAQNYAIERSLDLVEISPQARPPVCRVMDYGKWKYEQNVKEKQARKHRSQITVKEIKFRPKIGAADYETKKNHVRRFLEGEDKVKVTIMFRGREVVHNELGRNILLRVAEDVSDVGIVETQPNLEGRNMTMMIAPVKKKEVPKPAAEVAPADGDAPDVAVDDAPAEAPVADADAEAPVADAAVDAPADAPVADAPAEAPVAEADADATADA